MYEYTWGEAAVDYPDWVGTLELDEKITGTEDIYSITGVDEEKFQIIGIDFGGGESGWHPLKVIAVRTSDIDDHVANMSELKAVSIQIPDVEPAELLRRIMKLLDVRLRLRAVRDATIRVGESFGEPPQD